MDGCLHCGKRLPVMARGLCQRCYKDKAVRVLYPPAVRRYTPPAREATEEELDALVESRRPTMPGRDPGEAEAEPPPCAAFVVRRLYRHNGIPVYF